jgi:hypothetical protein
MIALVLVLAGGTALADEVRGIVTRTDPARKEFAIEGRGKGVRGLPLTFTLAADAEVLVDRKPGKLADLRPGARVRIEYELRDGKRVALRVAAHGGPKPDRLAMPADDKTVAGKLIRVALTDREIVVISPGPGEEIETTLAVPENTVIMKDQKAIKLDDLKEGQHVVVRTDQRDGKRIATSIQVGDAAPAADRKLERVRQFLKLAEQILDMAEQMRNGKP